MKVPTRHYRMYPLSMELSDFYAKNFGPENHPLECSPADSALICIDGWNLLDLDVPANGPFVDLTYVGSIDMMEKTRAIIRQRIAPLFDAARASGMQIIHSMPTYIANREEYRPFHIFPDMNPPLPRWEDWPPREFRLAIRAEMYEWESSKEAYQAWPEVRKKMDFSPMLKPLEGDIVMPQDHATVLRLQRLFKERRILNLFYCGFLSNCCVMHKQGGTEDMAHRMGYRVIVLRDCIFSHETEDTVEDLTFNKVFTKYFELGRYSTADSRDLISALDQERE